MKKSKSGGITEFFGSCNHIVYCQNEKNGPSCIEKIYVWVDKIPAKISIGITYFRVAKG